tara:strand:+ start:179 stop:364 length:186 start_codon:yes stop_codon:yes gene_type:complete
MKTPEITIKSTKAQIVEAANEFISHQDHLLNVATRRVKNHTQLVRFLMIALALTFILAPAF